MIRVGGFPGCKPNPAYVHKTRHKRGAPWLRFKADDITIRAPIQKELIHCEWEVPKVIPGIRNRIGVENAAAEEAAEVPLVVAETEEPDSLTELVSQEIQLPGRGIEDQLLCLERMGVPDENGYGRWRRRNRMG